MELAWVSMSAFSSSSVRPSVPVTSRNFTCSLSLRRNLLRLPSSANHKSKVRLHRFVPEAVVSNNTAKVKNDSIQERELHSSVADDFFDEHGEIRRDSNSEEEDDPKMAVVCDKLIDVFMVDKPNTTDWRRLLAFSREWSNIRPHFYKRCQDRADSQFQHEIKHKLLKFARKLKEVDEDIQRHDELLAVIKKAPSEINEIVVRRRKDFTEEFFIHLHNVAESYHDNPTEQNTVVKLGDLCLAAIQVHDTATESIEALNVAELKFQDIVNSPSLDVACRKIDDLAAKNQLDSALVLMITKAWSAAKESNMTKGEVKDILYHLYMTAQGNLQRFMPKEIMILKYLITIEDPEEELCALRDAFTPPVEEHDVDPLYTTPEKLHTWIKAVVDAYNFSKVGTLLKEARDLMNPKIIQRLGRLQKLILDNFM